MLGLIKGGLYYCFFSFLFQGATLGGAQVLFMVLWSRTILGDAQEAIWDATAQIRLSCV